MRADKDKLFSYVVFGTALSLALVLFFLYGFHFSFILLFFGLFVVLCELFPIELPRVGTTAITSLVLIATWLSQKPVETIFVCLFACFWPDLKKEFHVILFNTGQLILSAGVAAWFYFVVNGHNVTFVFPFSLIPFVLSALIIFVINSSLFSISVGIAENVNIMRVWIDTNRWNLMNFFSIAVLALAFNEIRVSVGLFGIALLLVPLIVARQTYQYYVKLTDAYAETISSLVKAVEAKDLYTKGHSERVAELSAMIANQINLSEEKIEQLKQVAILHDIGKIGVPKEILIKPGKLDEEEFAYIKEHPKIGAQILKNVEFLQDLIPAIFHHHERIDGNGYNSGLIGNKIPLFARIIAIADSYDAMTSNRAYRKALSSEKVIDEFKNGSGSQFDPELVKALFEVLSLDKSTEQSGKIVPVAMKPHFENI